jgi:hypothetical protein
MTSKWREGCCTRQSDCQIKHWTAHYPALVIKIANAQSEKKVSLLADLSTLRSSGSIQMVIGISLDYGKSKRTFVLICCPEYIANGPRKYLVVREIVKLRV